MLTVCECVSVCAEVISFIAPTRALPFPHRQVGGVVCFTTINRTVSSFMFGILGAEYVARLLPPGTHEWTKFVKPEELCAHLEAAGCLPTKVVGFSYNPLTATWAVRDDTSINFGVIAQRREL